MGLQRLHVPSWSGDFELAPVAEGESADDRCKLVTENLTEVEHEKIGHFLAKARQYKWVDKAAGVVPTGRCELIIEAPLSKCALHLIGSTVPERGRLTAIRSKAGSILTTVVGDEPHADEKVAEAAADKEAGIGAAIKRFTKCCPHPVEGPMVRSSRVLKTFCNRQQWEDWVKHGYLIAHGHLSGNAYRICHRHHPWSREQGFICFDLTDQNVVHGYDWSVPPAEEVLTFKLAVEHAEQWIRCPASMVGMILSDSSETEGRRQHDSEFITFRDPSDNGFREGLWDASVLATLGNAATGVVVGSAVRGLIEGKRAPSEGLSPIERERVRSLLKDTGQLARALGGLFT